MKNVLLYGLLLLYTGIITGSESLEPPDPCQYGNYKTIPNIGLRYVNYKIDESETPLNDASLPEAWYFVGEKMPEKPPSEIYSCGTKFPVWLDGEHTTDGSVKDATACSKGLFETCTKKFPIKLKYCIDNSTFIYYLESTSHFTEGYCFGEGNAGEKPKYVAPKPDVKHEVRTTAKGKYIRTRVQFICVFEKSKTEELFYQVSWYSDADVQYISPYRQLSNDPGLYLTEDRFVENKFQMGKNISCSVRAFTVEQGPPGKASPISSAHFVGLKIKTPVLTFARGSTGLLTVSPTVPIGCEGTTTGFCKLRLTTYTLETCTEIAVQTGTCGSAINSTDTEVTIPITNAETGKYLTNTDEYNLYLKTDDTPENLIWRNYHLPPVKVYITPSIKTTSYEGKTCSATTDPHMRTYNGRRYENHQKGVFTIYKNENFQSEIQIQHELCNTRGAQITCPCGVAVRSGNDRYIISVCDHKMIVGYFECGDNNLKVNRKDIYHYKVLLPYGTNIEAVINKNNFAGKNDNDRVMNVFVKPSIHDMNGAAKGLCGRLEPDCLHDFHDRQGKDVDNNDHCARGLNYNQQPMNFINAWKADTSENLFSDKYKMPTNNAALHRICNCPDTTSNTNIGTSAPTGAIPCNPNTASVCLGGKTIGAHSCENPSRRRRSVEGNPQIPVVEIPKTPVTHQIQKRETTVPNWTEAKARDYCSKYMDTSPIFSLCDTVPNARPEESIEECVMDIMLTNSTEWSSLSMENMRIACLSELERNTTLRESIANKSSIAEIIEDKACSDNCSGVGICIKGQCQCNQGYGASDCSLDLSKPPILSGLLDGGLCDEQKLDCDHTYVFGHVFSDGKNLTCRLQEFSVTVDGIRKNGSHSYLPGEFETLIEVICPVHQIRHKRSISANTEEFVFGYNVAVSNDGKTYQEGHDLFVYNSECQLAETKGETVHFTLKKGYCFIDNICVVSGAHESQDKCSVCDVGQSTSSWTIDESINGCKGSGIPPNNIPGGTPNNIPDSSKPDADGKVSLKPDTNASTTSYLWVIGVVAGVVAGAIVTTIVILKLLKKRSRKRIGDSTMLDPHREIPETGQRRGT